MNLRQLAEQDARAILGDVSFGFGWTLQITDPALTVGSFTGFSADIAQVIDPDTGQVVSGRVASVAVSLKDFTDKGMGYPRGVANSKSKPWIVEFNDLFETPHKFKVSQSNPDRTIGMITLILESYA